MEDLVLKLELSVAHINVILKHLGAGAYAEVADVIAFLHGQAKPQVEEAAANQTSNPVMSDQTAQ